MKSKQFDSFYDAFRKVKLEKNCFKFLKTYIFSCQFQKIFVLKKVKIFLREYLS